MLEEKLYRTKTRIEFLLSHPKCQVCGKRKSTQVHHKRGKRGPLLNDVRHFLAVEMECHDWITNHTTEAREQGFLCPAGLWNTPDRT